MAETQHTQLVCYTLLCILVMAILVKLKHMRASASRLNLPPGPWVLPVIGHMHLLLGAIPYQAMHRLARQHGPVMLLRLGHVPTLVLSSAEAAREVMKVHDAAFADRPVYATADIFTYGGEDISFARHDSRHWKALRKLCAVELLSPRRVRSFRHVREEEAARLVLSVAGAGRIVNVGDMLKVMMNDVVMRASVGDRCVQRDAYLEELDRVLDLMSGFNLIDLFPASRLARAIGGRALGATWEVHRRIHSIMDAMISDHRTAMEGEDDNDAGCEQRGDILTTLLRFQRDGGIGGVALTNEKISGVLFGIFPSVKEVATAIREWKPLDVHPDLYGAVMTQGGFSDEALMAALSHLLDNKAQGVGFVAMADAHRGKWYAVFIGEVPGVYSSWEEANAQVASYSNNNYRGFKTKQAAEQAYSAWVRKHGGNSVDSAKVGAVKVEAAKVDRQFSLKLKNFMIFAQFITSAVLWC
ncbi:dolabradiene monooxygenase-like [Triticum urartu]|nr:dolabradiene monooxygenase-like [Triticum urartu]